MGRKNSRVKRSNDRKRYARLAAEAIPKPKVRVAPRRIEDLVVPAGRCFLQSRRGKAIYATEALARKALEHAQRDRSATGSGHVEKRFYPCPDGGCGGYHLTSRDEYETRDRP